MVEYALRNELNTALIERRLTAQRIHQIIKEARGTGQLMPEDLGTLDAETEAWLQQFDIVKVEEVPAPAPTFGEEITEDQAGEFVGGAWRQKWIVQQGLTLAQAKQACADLARDIYIARVTAPTPQQLLSAGTYVAAVQAREVQYGPKLADVAARIQAAGDVAECYAIYIELEQYAPP